MDIVQKISGLLKPLALLIGSVTFCFSQPVQIPSIQFSPKRYICYYSSEPITVDGKLNDSAWSKAEWTDDFVDIEGSAKPVPRYRTRVKMLWDEHYLYIAAELQEPDIWATLKNRDTVIFRDNDFEIFIDPDGDTRDYSEFEMNAFNTVWDLLLEMPYRDIDRAAKNGWDIKGLKTGVSIYGSLNKPGDKDSCWTVEVAFPWEGFKEITDASNPPNDQDQWRINFSRVEWRTETKNGVYQKQINPETHRPYPEDNWVWSPQGLVDMHYPEMWGYVQFSREIVGGKKIPFAEKSEEAAKWFLRQIYYRERLFFYKNGTYTNELMKLAIEAYPVPGYATLPFLECTTNMFEASLQSIDHTVTMHIRTDGLTWVSREKK